jgi:hypothetical protein
LKFENRLKLEDKLNWISHVIEDTRKDIRSDNPHAIKDAKFFIGLCKKNCPSIGLE